jgi:hypothetical protein
VSARDGVIDQMRMALSLDAAPSTVTIARWLGELEGAIRAEESAWLSEGAARLRSGWSLRTLREHYAGWAAEGFARTREGAREYLTPVVPRRRPADGADDAVAQARRDAAA